MSDNPEALLADLRQWREHLMSATVPVELPHRPIRVVLDEAIAALAQQAATPTDPLTDSYVQTVPDKCDRIVWRNTYYSLPLAPNAVRAFEEAMVQSWRMIDPLHPAGQPGSYARGQDAGIAAALKTMRENFERLMSARQAATPMEAALLDDLPPLPDSIRVPLHSLWADAGYLIGRASHGDTDLAVRTIKSRCDEAEGAIRSVLAAARQAATPAPAEPVAIDYDALIAYCSKKYRWAQGTPRCSAFAKGAEWMRDQIAAPPATPAAQPADGWIVVADRLPYSEAENGERVLVCTAEDDFAGVQFHDIKATDFFEVDEEGRMGTEVTEVATHWRPRVLPAAPEGGQG